MIAHERKIDVIVAKSWIDARNIINRRFSSGVWMFRGQGDRTWPLQPNIERAIFQNNIKDAQFAEEVMLTIFKKRAIKYFDSSLRKPETKLEWLAMLQHYEAPTRLLDFSYSPYIACFFAMENALNKRKQCAIWLVNAVWLNKQSTLRLIRQDEEMKKEHDRLGFSTFSTHLSQGYYFDEAFQNDKCESIVYSVNPDHLNERLRNQQGLFLCPGDLYKNSFMDQILSYGNIKPYVKKIVIPNRFRDEAMQDLRYMNFDYETIYTGLVGLGLSMRDRVFYEGTPKQDKNRQFRGRP